MNFVYQSIHGSVLVMPGAVERGHMLAIDGSNAAITMLLRRGPVTEAIAEACSSYAGRPIESITLAPVDFERFRDEAVCAMAGVRHWADPEETEVEAAQAKALATPPTRINLDARLPQDGPMWSGSGWVLRPTHSNVEVYVPHALVIALMDIWRHGEMIRADALGTAVSQAKPTLPGKIALVQQFLDEDLFCEDLLCEDA